MSNKTFKVCTYHVNFNDIVNNTTDSLYKKIYELTSIINKKYCEIHNYNYSFDLFTKNDLTNFLDTEIFDLNNDWDKSGIFKYQYLLEQLEKSTEDYIVYIEYDACFCNNILKLEDYIDNEHNIFYSRCNWSYDLFYTWNNKIHNIINWLNSNFNEIADYNKCAITLASDNFLTELIALRNIFFCNEGFFIFKNTDISKQFLRAIVKYATVFYDYTKACITEGQVLQFIMSKEKFINHLQVLPPQTQGHIYGDSNRYNEDNCLVCHNSSIDKEIVYEFIKNNIMKNKYWSKYFN